MISASAAAVEPAQAIVLVGGYQALGVDAKRVTELEAAVRAALGSRPVRVLSTEETEKLRRGLSQCGEDPACLASIGERAGARWVLGHGVAKVGTAVLVNLLWVDVLQGKTVASASKRVNAAQLGTTATALVEELVKGLELAPPPAEPPPSPPPAVLVPIEPPPPTVAPVPAPTPAPPAAVAVKAGRPLRTVAVVTGAATGLAAIATTVVGLMARSNYLALSAARTDPPRTDLARRQRTLNLGADAALGAAIAVGTTTVVLIVIDQLGAE